MKRVLSCTMAIAMLCSLLTVPSHAATTRPAATSITNGVADASYEDIININYGTGWLSYSKGQLTYNNTPRVYANSGYTYTSGGSEVKTETRTSAMPEYHTSSYQIWYYNGSPNGTAAVAGSTVAVNYDGDSVIVPAGYTSFSGNVWWYNVPASWTEPTNTSYTYWPASTTSYGDYTGNAYISNSALNYVQPYTYNYTNTSTLGHFSNEKTWGRRLSHNATWFTGNRIENPSGDIRISQITWYLDAPESEPTANYEKHAFTYGDQKILNLTSTRTRLDKIKTKDGAECNITSLILNNCTNDRTIIPIGTCDINGGNYSGTPALQSGAITVNKGTLTDNYGSKSTYIIGADSEAASTTSGTTTVTQVKLSNPPVVIDWSTFPMPDLSAPVIEVTRDPSDTKTPTGQVTLTIKATDPDGNDSDTPLSIDGGAFQSSPATYTVSENGPVDIIARDKSGNTRTFTANVNNIDSESPTIQGFTSSNTEWTKDPVRVTVNATDDVKLDAAAYKWSFTPNITGSTQTGTWTSEKSIKVDEAGKIQVDVRDAMGHITTSDIYEVSNIDKIAPTATVSTSPDAAHEASSKTGVTAELALKNTTDTVTDQASPLSDTGVLWDESEGWTSKTTHTVKENGVYYVKVRDAVGNVSDPIQYTINNISTSLPVIDSFTGTNSAAEFCKSPVSLSVDAHASGSSTLPARPYSWDDGATWTSQKTHPITENGEYNVIVRDSVGNETSASMIVSNIDGTPPTAGVYVYKGLPADGTGTGPDDYVWKVRVEADDLGSGVDHIETLWDSGTSTVTPVIQDLAEPGIYGAIVYDKAGNKTYAEKVVTAESIGESAGTANGSYVDIKIPSSGSAGSYFNAALQDLVYGPTGAYNKNTSTFMPYQSGSEGINANITATGKSGRTMSGYATFNSVKYPVTFSGASSIAAGSNVPCEVYVPISTVTSDVRNGRLTIVLQEWTDASMTTLAREGSATLYTSVQVNKPKLTYEYNAATDELLVTGASAVAGVADIGAQLDGGAMQTTFPVTVGSATSIRMVVRDNVAQETELTVTKDQLKLNGSAGGLLPTEMLGDSSVNSYVVTTRNSTTYIINGSQSNTDTVPSAEVFNSLMD